MSCTAAMLFHSSPVFIYSPIVDRLGNSSYVSLLPVACPSTTPLTNVHLVDRPHVLHYPPALLPRFPAPAQLLIRDSSLLTATAQSQTDTQGAATNPGQSL